MKYTKGMVQVTMVRNWKRERHELPGILAEGIPLGIFKDDRGRYSLTHTPSGACIKTTGTQREAKHLVEALAELSDIDWNALTGGSIRRIAEVIRGREVERI